MGAGLNVALVSIDAETGTTEAGSTYRPTGNSHIVPAEVQVADADDVKIIGEFTCHVTSIDVDATSLRPHVTSRDVITSSSRD